MCSVFCRDLPSSTRALSVACRSTSRPIATACLKITLSRVIALRAVSPLSCQIGARAVRMSFWSRSSIGSRPSFGSTCSASGENQRPALPSPLSCALRASKHSCATRASVGRSAAASRLSRSRSRIGSKPAAATLRQRSASVRASFSETSVSEPKPISRRRHATVTRNTHCAPPSGRLCSQRPAPSLYLPGGRLLICTAVNRCMARILNPPFHPPWSVRCTDTRGNLTQATDMSILCKFSRLGRMGLGRHGNSMPTTRTSRSAEALDQRHRGRRVRPWRR